ncbi:outer membrane protein [Bacteroides heparinolyticus]|uniref:Uncharacterized protein n=7 Tax=Prevotella heparinolytica TaxID=28113 RepID=A0A3P2AAX2_9BACE|nr:outer membrane beta-barrel protein [Bacteroides heparinolyticus]RRD91380.1 hypothetical protein EII33_07120 [Bacteroides heparinolyticus]VFB13347.1 Uncharacterised protein [Bacteroides heparinolyticus]
MRHCLFLLFSLFFTNVVCAQQDASSHDFFIGYGFAPIGSVSEPELPLNPWVNAPYTTNNKHFSGTLNAGYLYHVSKPLAIGVTYSYLTVKRDVVLGSSIPLAEIKNDCHVLMLTGKYTWFHLKRFSFYSRAGVGIMLVKKGTINVHKEDINASLESVPMEDGKSLAWQVVPVGVEWNFAKHLSLFAEGGAGASGYGIAGVKVSF